MVIKLFCIIGIEIEVVQSVYNVWISG